MKINNYTELKSEIARLEIKSKQQEEQLMDKLHELRSAFSPQNIVLNSLSSITGIPLNKADFVKKGLMVAATFIFQKFLRKSELKLETVIENWVKEITGKVKNFFRKNVSEEEEN